MNHISQNKRHVRGGKWRVAPAMTLGLALFLTGCESLLEVELFGTVSSDVLDDPASAELMVNTAISKAECGYSRFGAGNPVSDVFWQSDRKSDGPDMHMEYQDIVDGRGEPRGCQDGSDFDDGRQSWFNEMQEARFHAEDGYFRFDTLYTQGDGGEFDIENFLTGDWGNIGRMQAVMALYAAIPYMLFGEHLCEVTIEKSQPTARLPDPLRIMDPDTTLGIAEEWINTFFVHWNAYVTDTVANGGDPVDVIELPFGITTDAGQMGYGLRARIKWARGDLAGAAVDAALVSNGFMAFATRTDNPSDLDRQNHIHGAHHRSRLLVSPGGTIAGPVDWWIDPHPPGTWPGQPWPLNGAGPEALIPFTGYLDLVIDATGRAVDPVGNALTILNTPGGTPDTRVEHLPGLDRNSDPADIPQKYTSAADPIPMVNWKEMVLIRAEAAPASAVALVNEIRAADGMPLVTYAPVGGEIENMIFEEKRRALWLEGRFWSTKIQNQLPTASQKLWFPREQKSQLEGPPTRVARDILQGGVRQRMRTQEFDRNPSISRQDFASLCPVEQRPVGRCLFGSVDHDC